jgi:hypothetical protein
VTTDGRTFLAASYFTGGQPSAVLDNPMDGTEDDSLYRQGRYGSHFGYNLPTGNGTFDVILHFRETYWNMMQGVPSDFNSRRFNVDVEGTRQLTEYSILGATFGQNTFVREAFRVTVTDDMLNLHFTKGSADLAYVSAIEVVPADANTYRINAGGPAYTVSGNRLFLSDQYFKGGTSSVRGLDGGLFNRPGEEPLYWRARFGSSFNYDIPTGNGAYEVTLHFSEPYWGYAAGRGGVGSRKFNVDAEGGRKLTDYDIFAQAGGANRAVQEQFAVSVTDGVLNLLFTKGSADLARVWAIEVVRVPGAARVAAAGTEGAGVRLYPNPARDRLYVKLSGPAAGISATSVTTAAGQTVLLNPHRVVGEHELEIRVDGLRSGLYLLRLQGPQGRQVIRFTKQ